ncbi:MAG: NAD(P)-dependent oxidoreductase, partial [Candidatus Omnitrophota bacterium]
MSKAIVFGGSGFLGSYVADILSGKGNEVVIYDLKPSRYIKSHQTMIVGDILDFKKVKEAVREAQIVYNFAGIADVNEASREPIKTIEQNILGNTYILEAIKESKIERYVFASTVYVYSKAGSFYRTSKQACELYIEDYAEKYKVPYTILR